MQIDTDNSVLAAVQYIVKPPRSSRAGFAWHCDSQWLADGNQHSPYISVSHLLQLEMLRLALQQDMQA